MTGSVSQRNVSTLLLYTPPQWKLDTFTTKHVFS